MPTLHSQDDFTVTGPMEPCRWCGRPTDLSFAPAGSRIGPVPLHIMCGVAVLVAYERWSEGQRLTVREQRRLGAALGLPSGA